ncbi:ribosomal L7Ae/L30e/S12e/Gadd45 family protein [Nanoarchaeota archaeon]
MVVKKTIKTAASDLKKLLETGNIVFGTERTLKLLKLSKIQKVFLASNCPDLVRTDIHYYSELSSTEIVELAYPNDELGTICKKPFSVSVIGLLK